MAVGKLNFRQAPSIVNHIIVIERSVGQKIELIVVQFE
jgi:hypothetical protein